MRSLSKPSSLQRQGKFNDTVKHSGNNSLKISTIASGGYIEAKYNSKVYFGSGKYKIPVKPSKEYTCTFWMKTNYVSGDSNIGVPMMILFVGVILEI